MAFTPPLTESKCFAAVASGLSQAANDASEAVRKFGEACGHDPQRRLRGGIPEVAVAALHGTEVVVPAAALEPFERIQISRANHRRHEVNKAAERRNQEAPPVMPEEAPAQNTGDRRITFEE